MGRADQRIAHAQAEVEGLIANVHRGGYEGHGEPHENRTVLRVSRPQKANSSAERTGQIEPPDQLTWIPGRGASQSARR